MFSPSSSFSSSLGHGSGRQQWRIIDDDDKEEEGEKRGGYEEEEEEEEEEGDDGSRCRPTAPPGMAGGSTTRSPTRRSASAASWLRMSEASLETRDPCGGRYSTISLLRRGSLLSDGRSCSLARLRFPVGSLSPTLDHRSVLPLFRRSLSS